MFLKLLENACTWLYGNTVLTTFELEPTLEQYF